MKISNGFKDNDEIWIKKEITDGYLHLFEFECFKIGGTILEKKFGTKTKLFVEMEHPIYSNAFHMSKNQLILNLMKQ